MSFLDHLEELRWHLVRAVIAILIGAIIAFIIAHYVFDTIIFAPVAPDFITYKLLCQLGDFLSVSSLCMEGAPIDKFQNLQLGSQFTWHIWASIIMGLIIAFPYVVYEFWRFVMPALHDQEKKNATGAVFFISLLFFIGVCFAYFLLIPLTINFFATYHVSDKIENNFVFTSYISTFTTILLWTGVIFELPIFIYFLAKIGVVSSKFLKRYRRHALILILILSAIITPPDIASQILVSIPLALLYEIGIIIAKRVERRRDALELATSKKAVTKQ